MKRYVRTEGGFDTIAEWLERKTMNINEEATKRLIEIAEGFHPKPEAMSREEFKRRWDADDGITNDEVADCYVAWRLGSYPRTKPIDLVIERVLKAAGCEWDEE